MTDPSQPTGQMAVNAALTRFAIEMAAQMALSDGANFVTARAVARRIIADKASANERAEIETMLTGVIERAAVLLIRQGVTPT